MKSFKHWTPRYVVDRVALMLHERRNPNLPWLTPDMVQILSTWLQPSDKGLEWGSGRSTAWFAKRLGSLISVEHNSAWYQKVKSMLKEHQLTNVDYRLLENEDAYASVAEQIEPGSLNFVLVDGIVRDRCALQAIPLLHPGGILIVDNCNWYLPGEQHAPASRSESQGPATPMWTDFYEQVRGWRHIWTSSGVTATALWEKPTSAQKSQSHDTAQLRELIAN